MRKTFPTFKRAADYEKEAVAQVSRGDFILPSKDTVKDLADKWHKRKADANTYAFATLGNWRTHIDKYIIPTLGDLPVRTVGIEAVEKAAAEWAKMTSLNTANKALTPLTAIFKLGQRYGPIQGNANVAELAERLKTSNEEEDDDEQIRPEEVYSGEELSKLISATEPGTLERVLVMIPALTGLRIGEVLGQVWPAVDLKANKLIVRQSLVHEDKKKGGRKLARPKSKSSRRSLDLPQELGHESKLWKLKCPCSENDLVLATIEGKPFHRKAATRIIDGAIAKAKLEKRLTLHKLRHTFASLLLSRHVPIPKVSRLLGRRDSVITMKVYAHFIEDKKNDVQDLASSILSAQKNVF